MTSSGLVVPVVLWGKTAPTHCISCLLVTSDQKTIISGCHDGQICLWDLTEDAQIIPRCMLFGHSASISCLSKASETWDSSTFISAAENGELCLWDVADGRCIEQNRLPGVHLSMQPYQMNSGKGREWRIICQGYYPDINVLDATSLELLYSLSSSVAPDWISAFCIIRPLKRNDDIVIGVTTTGMLKVWNLSSSVKRENEPTCEEECKQLRCRNAKAVTCCAFTLRTVLIVCSKKWQIYDAGDFSQLCVEASEKGQHWIGGEFTAADRVLVWSSNGKGYLYQLPSNCIPESDDFRSHVGRSPESATRPFLYCVLEAARDQLLSCTPAMTFFYGRRGSFFKLFIRGDSSGRLTVWKIPEVSDKELSFLKQEEFDTLPVLPPTSSNSLQEAWDSCSPKPAGIIDQLCPSRRGDKQSKLQVTASIYIAREGWLVCGRSNGSILIVPAVQSAIAQLLEGPHTARKGWPPHRILKGHHGRVTCLLYPHQDHPRYDHTHLVSGGIDFTVCLWDLFSGNKLHTFCVHGGELTQLLVPPENCNARVLTCICSVATDHSVALLSLRDRKCTLLASRHLFPIRAIKWRPAEDFLVVALEDGSVFVWQMETGHLDRIAEGTTAEEILSACAALNRAHEVMLTPTQSIAQAFRRRSLAAIKNAAHRTLLAAAQGSVDNIPTTEGSISKDPNHALTIQSVKANVKDSDFHVLFFDAEVLIVQLLTDKNLIPGIISQSSGSHPDLTRLARLSEKEPKATKLTQKVAGFITKQIDSMRDSDDDESEVTDPSRPPAPKISVTQAEPSPLPLSHQKGGGKGLTLENTHLTLDIAQLFMSCLHAWGLDSTLDQICLEKLGLLKPHDSVSFGLISHGVHMSLMLPGWLPRAHGSRLKSSSSNSSQLSAKEALEMKMKTSPQRDTPPLTPGGRDAPQTLEELDKSRIYLSHWALSRAVTTQHLLSVISVGNTLMGMNNASFVMLSHFRKPKHKRSKLKGPKDEADGAEEDLSDLTPEQASIKQGWSLLAALHCVLLPDLLGSVAYKPPYLEMLARRWQDRCLEVRAAAQALLLAELRRITCDGREDVIQQWAPHLPFYVDSALSLIGSAGGGQASGGHGRDLSDSGSSDGSEVEQEAEILSGDSPVKKVSVSFESRRKQATAIVMLGVIGAEFGAEITPSKQKPSNLGQRQIQQGFGLTDYSLARHTAQALSFLLLQPPTSKLPAHTPIRRAGIDLLGRGFTVWEPYVDVSSVLLGLLELCCDPSLYAASMATGLPITPAADSCRSAHHALSLIATARPATFITTMAREVAKQQAQISQAQSPAVNIQVTTLYKAKAEILRIIELLIEKMQNDTVDLIVETVDILVFCLDSGRLRTRGLMDVFPAVCRFNMLSYCHNTKKIAVGAKNGSITIFDLKTSKSHTITGHTTAVTALGFSSDGKYLASYAFGDTKLFFWQTGSSLLGGLMNSATKCVKCYQTKPFTGSSTANELRQVSLSWPQPRAVILRNVDKTLDKFTI